jgi:hypothetical protein
MMHKIEDVLETLCEYYGNFAEDPRIVQFLRDTGEKAGLSTALDLGDDQLADIAAAGGTPNAKPAASLKFFRYKDEEKNP